MEKNLYTEEKIIDTLNKNYMPYAMSVIVSRAIPEIDGFKPSHRKLLYTMYKMGLLKGNRTKSANVVGQTMKLNPHGDMAIYETLVRLTTGNEALLHPFIDSKGNFGKVYSKDMRYAAPRYTEVRLHKFCREVFKDIDKDTVEFIDNYDGTLKEPLLLPTTFPNILVNPNQGIAVGMASNICSFNLNEVCDAAIAYIKDSADDMLKYLKAPDFPTGGQILYNEKELRNIYEHGRGSFKLRGKYRYDKKNSCIEIYEIPYTTTSEAIIDAIAALVKSGKVKEILDVRDETDLRGLKITVDVKKSTVLEQLMNKLFLMTPLQDTFSCNFNILINGRPKVLGIKAIFKEWVNFRVECIKRGIIFDINRDSKRLHLLLGLKKILLDIDKAIHIVRNTENDADVIPNLMKTFAIDESQAEFVADIKLRNLNKEYILRQIKEVEKLKSKILEYKKLHENRDKILDIICKELEEISDKYGQERKTEIICEEHIKEISSEHLIEDYNLKLFLTKYNYIKKIPLVSLRAASEQKLKEDDYIIQEVETHNKATLLLFSNKYSVYKVKIHEIEDCKASELGTYLSNILEMEKNEKIIYMTATDDYRGYFLFAYENGKIAKIPLESYKTKTNRKKLANAYSEISPLVFMTYLVEDKEFAAISSINKVLVFDTSKISVKTTRSSQGVQVLRSKNGSKLVEILPLEKTGIKDPDYYRTKNIPATGCYLRESDKKDNQIRW